MKLVTNYSLIALCLALTIVCGSTGFAQDAANNMETELLKMDAAALARQARLRGDPNRGALVFYTSAAACIKCHMSGDEATPLGPDLATLGKDVTDQYVIESILRPSQAIRKGFETVSIVDLDGKEVTGLIASEDDERVVLRDAANLEQEIVVKKSDIDEKVASRKSMMPDGLVTSLRDRGQFFDLARYVMEVAHGGPDRARQLKPNPADLVVQDDSKNLDHAGILRALGQKDFEAGESIYLGHCKNCHGVDGNTPTLPTARAFGRQELKFGADPYKMLLTLTRGNGLMTPMTHLSPKERYQVIHYIREALMKPSNPVYVVTDDAYLNGLPKGNSKGEFTIAAERDYGPVLGSQLGGSINNSLTFRLPGEVTVNYDLHRMRFGGAWQGGFLDLSQTQHYRQRGERMPQPDGEPIAGLGAWQWAFDGTFDIPSDAKPPRGPVRGDWLQYYGHYLHADQAVLSYAIHGRKILETLTANKAGELVTIQHTLRVDAGDQELKLYVGGLGKSPAFAGVLPLGKPEAAARTAPAKGHLAIVAGSADSSAVRARAARQDRPRMANKPRHVVAGNNARKLDLGTAGRTVSVRFRTRAGGTLVASAPASGEWKPNGKTLYIRGNRLVYDIGWVGALSGKTNVTDNKWHTAALVVDQERTRLYVDGKLEGEKRAFRRDPVDGHVLKVGATATEFGGDFRGDIAWLRIYDEAMPADRIAALAAGSESADTDALFAWKPVGGTAPPDPKTKPTVAKGATEKAGPKTTPTAIPAKFEFLVGAAVAGDTDGMTWSINGDGRIVLTIPASDRPRVFRVFRGADSAENALGRFSEYATSAITSPRPTDPQDMTHGGPERWTADITVEGMLGEPVNGYALDTITVPFTNPFNAWLRTSALDFFDDGRCVVTTHGGDVWIVSGIDEQLGEVTWSRFCAGLFEPFGVRVVDGQIYVTCRDGIKRLHDYDGNGEADFVEAFWIDDDVSCMFHAYNFDLQTDSQGNFYFAKAGQYTHHHRPGTIMRVPPAGGKADVVAWGIRTPNGMGKLDDDRFTVSDNQGPWMPAGKVSLIKPNSYLGNMPINKEQDAWLKAKHGGQLPETFDEPVIWTPQELDNSCGGQVWAGDNRWGPLSGRLIHSSFGKGWLYYMSLQDAGGQTQASIVALPHQWDAGVMRLRVNPADGQVYGTGLSGWQGPRGGKDGCLQRLRYTGDTVRMIDAVRVTPTGIELTFNFSLDAPTAGQSDAWKAEMWDYLWSKKYGSDQFSVLKPGTKGRDKLLVESVTLSDGGRKAHLAIPDLAVCDQVSLKMKFKDAGGDDFSEHVYLTIHAIPGR